MAFARGTFARDCSTHQAGERHAAQQQAASYSVALVTPFGQRTLLDIRVVSFFKNKFM